VGSKILFIGVLVIIAVVALVSYSGNAQIDPGNQCGEEDEYYKINSAQSTGMEIILDEIAEFINLYGEPEETDSGELINGVLFFRGGAPISCGTTSGILASGEDEVPEAKNLLQTFGANFDDTSLATETDIKALEEACDAISSDVKEASANRAIDNCKGLSNIGSGVDPIPGENADGSPNPDAGEPDVRFSCRCDSNPKKTFCRQSRGWIEECALDDDSFNWDESVVVKETPGTSGGGPTFSYYCVYGGNHVAEGEYGLRCDNHRCIGAAAGSPL
jgi:hypothetical protein